MILLLLSFAFSLNIPKNLNESDRGEVLKLLGVGTSSKYNTEAEPLGGFSGLEFGISMESLPSEDLNDLGSGTTNDDRFEYTKITIGKGLFHYIDVFAHFIPFDEQTGLSQYGGILRWQAFESPNAFFSGAILLHFNSSNIDDLFISDTYGGQVHIIWHIGNLDLYAGWGQTRVKGRFKGGVDTITDTGLEVNQKATESVIVGGLSVSFRRYFLAFEANDSDYLSLAGKIGMRF